jgi:hypothetical protein
MATQGTGSLGTGLTNVHIHIHGQASVSIQVAPAGSSTSLPYMSSSSSPCSPAPVQSSSQEEIHITDFAQTERDSDRKPSVPQTTAVADKGTQNDDGFELINETTKDIPFYWNAVPERPPGYLCQQEGRLAIAPNALSTTGELCSGLERITYAYNSGRQAAKVFRGEAPTVEPKKFNLNRSPSYYIILRGGKQGEIYPKTCRTFRDYKQHVFSDGEKARPSHFFGHAISCAFHSEVEAKAYAIGAGLKALP